MEGAILKQDGQKSDDAEVPIRLWDSMFCSSLPSGDIPRVGWRMALSQLRAGFILVWRRRVLRSWTNWTLRAISQRFLGAHYPASWAEARRAVHPLESMLTDALVRARLVSPGARIRKAKDASSARQHASDWLYEWTTGGLASYKAWHAGRRKHDKLHGAMDPMIDCVRRCAEASWWEWT